MDIGILGGTFDPIHVGHLVIAEEVRIKLNLDRVFFIPAGEPWLKHGGVSVAAHRTEMVRRAISSNPHFELLTLEVDRAGPTYTVDTVSELQQMFGAQAKLFLILGVDTLIQLPEWKEPERLISMCQLVAVNRPGCSAPAFSQLNAAIPGVSSRIIMMEVPEIGISSTEIRKRIGQGLSIRYLVPEAVQKYIQEHRLYSQQ